VKNKTKELDVDYIGGQGKPLTKEEELAITNFINNLRVKRAKIMKRKISKSEKQSK
jgi:hypothetical protein